MSLIPETKRCPKCNKTYKFNPDVGVGLRCPHCGGLGNLSGDMRKQKPQRDKKQ